MHTDATGGASHTSRKPTTPRICSLAAVGRASHWSAGPPAAAISEKARVGTVAVVEPRGAQMFRGKTCKVTSGAAGVGVRWAALR